MTWVLSVGNYMNGGSTRGQVMIELRFVTIIMMYLYVLVTLGIGLWSEI